MPEFQPKFVLNTERCWLPFLILSGFIQQHTVQPLSGIAEPTEYQRSPTPDSWRKASAPPYLPSVFSGAGSGILATLAPSRAMSGSNPSSNEA